ncbi:major facilitator superfamily domain-containing protein [Sphaerosporella brunnea]|uniref:Major facilitator superfamily domain-containing protein n=1 Tax=Sphaerosporella brunnea TaxID=1250544 RepID=A0A5J5F5V2_9PEZI|nr:major facilitator superfamily domain-containing protein [Sphaerosporella brunnea]
MASSPSGKTLSEFAAREGSASSHGYEDYRKSVLSKFSVEDEKRVMRKVDRKFLLLIGVLYLIKNLDYQNAASIKVLQVGQPSNILNELRMTADEYNWVQSIYFISYIIFEVPSNLFLKRMTPRLWQTRIVFSWGLVLACHAAVQNKHGIWTARFFLGMMEAGMFPGITAQLCSWYRSDEMAKPITWFIGFQSCSGIVGSLLAYAISYMDGLGGLSAWRWVYLLEGIITILFAGIIWAVLPDYPQSPRSSSWLTPEEQEFLAVRLTENAPKFSDPDFDKQEVIKVLKDPRVYGFMASQLLVNLGGYGLSWYLPSITTNLGFAGLPRNQLLNIPPAAASVLAIVFAGWFCSRAYLTRPFFITLTMIGQVVCFVLLFTIESRIGLYIACVLGMMFYSVYFIPFWSWRSSTLTGSTGTAFSLAFQSCIGQVGGIVGPQLFRQKYAYNGYKTSFAICAAAIIAGFFANCWTWWLTRNVEWDTRRIRRLRIKAKKEGRLFNEDDVKVHVERKFYDGLKKRADV